MRARLFGWVTFALLLSSCGSGLFAVETNQSAAGLLNGIFGFARGLEINPKIITPLDGGGTTIGIEYKYENDLKRTALSQNTDVAFSIYSAGLAAVDPGRVPNDVFTHGVRLKVIDLWPAPPPEDSAAFKHHAALKRRINERYFDPWLDETDPNEMNELFDAAARELADYGELEAEFSPRKQWYLRNSSGRSTLGDSLNAIKERPIFLSFDLAADVEHDQSLTNLQFVGSAQIRGKLLLSWIDKPFELLRGGPPKNWLNRAGGPHFWAGIAMVNASENDARQALSTEHETFPRFHFGAQYRTELFSISETKSVALELAWRFYYEFDAPDPIKDAELDQTSYFKVTVLFPGNYFLEYTDGRLPVDVDSASTVSAGWRYNF